MEKTEAKGLALARFVVLDKDHDDALTSEETLAEVALPEMTYSDKMSITLAGKSVEMMHPGANHAPDMTVLIFPEEFAVYRAYFEDLKVAIDDAVAKGQTAADVVASDALIEYKDMPNYDPRRKRNIIGA